MHNEFYDKYEIIKELSCSTHSKVYLVRHRILDVYRVAKIFSGNQQDARRLMKEAHLIKNLKHPHIPVIYDIEQNIGEDNDSICIIEEYIDGKSLRQYVHDETDTRGYLSVHEICRIGIELCCILEYLHGYNGNGILHMDIKPDNIMLDKNGKVKLIDYDNAVEGNAGLTVESGSPLYAAPEQYNREKAVIQSDIYSLGMVILFMVSHGHIVTDENHKLSEISSRYSSLYHVINKSLHHEWGLRYSSVTYLKQELQSIMNWGGGTDEKLSYIIQVAGDKAGIGTTHTVMCMAHFLKKKGINCVVADRSGSRRVMPAFVKEGLMDDGSYIYQGIRIIPDYNNAISVTGIKAEVILVDSGHNMRCLMHDKCIVDMVGDNYSYTMVYVTGKHIYEEKKRFAKCSEDIVYMLNLVSAEQFYELSMMFKGKKCYRMPCIYDWCGDNPIFDETMNDFLQDNLSGLWKVYRPGRIKECIGRLYEKISSIRYIKRFKKKKSE